MQRPYEKCADKGQLAKSYGMWIQKREEARRAHAADRQAVDATHEAENEFKRDIEKLMDSEEAGEMRSMEVAEKVWQTDQSGCKKADNLDNDLLCIVQALKNYGSDRDRDESMKIRAECR